MLPDEARSRKRPTDLFRFVRMEDRKRALVSRLLQYSLVHEVLGIPSDEISINRTAEGKPYVECDQMNLEFPNFNFNTSHHGDYVAIASEPICLVGVDIVSRTIPKNEAVPEFILNFSSYFSTWEWSKIIYSNSCDEMLNEFYRYWCLKEAFVKAIGTGMWYRLDKIEFHHNRWSDIFVKIDGRELEDWKFWLSELGKGHWVSIAKGHPRAATDSYKRTLKRTEFDEEEYHLGLHLPNVSFELQTVDQLVRLLQRSEEDTT
ncbi:uncharacterized protein LOC131165337 isoform X3 [Malania oleifera]|uniref:uncharacterized protein LOC131165337 isoform X3 n=1 Tax=Malania oleifera TaxID=397392 RepID=UPI0025AE70E2|nr:uncharacterized protein LOC131165337 isoform X3 [Malania oleifera]